MAAGSRRRRRDDFGFILSVLVQPVTSLLAADGFSGDKNNLEKNFIEDIRCNINRININNIPEVDQLSSHLKPFAHFNIKTTEFPLEMKQIGQSCGIRNNGRTCYINSILQTLTANPTLIQASLYQIHSRECKLKRSECSLCCLEEFVNDKMMTDGSNKKNFIEVDFNDVLIPKKELLKNKSMGINKDGDPFDFWEFILKRMNKCSPNIETAFSVPNLFNFETKKIITCRECQTDFITDIEIQNIINIVDDFSDNKNILDCLKKTNFKQNIPFKNFECYKCRRITTADSKTRISKPPLYLSFSISRIENNQNNKKEDLLESSSDKIIPMVLDLTSVVDDKNKNDSNSFLYVPYAAVIHNGAYSGLSHFVAVTQSPDGSWSHYNDKVVKRIENELELKSYLNKSYLLFYRRIEPFSHELLDNKKYSREKVDQCRKTFDQKYDNPEYSAAEDAEYLTVNHSDEQKRNLEQSNSANNNHYNHNNSNNNNLEKLPTQLYSPVLKRGVGIFQTSKIISTRSLKKKYREQSLFEKLFRCFGRRERKLLP